MSSPNNSAFSRRRNRFFTHPINAWNLSIYFLTDWLKIVKWYLISKITTAQRFLDVATIFLCIQLKVRSQFFYETDLLDSDCECWVRERPLMTSLVFWLFLTYLPTYLHPISSLLEKAAYLMTSFFVWPTLPNFFYILTQIMYSNFCEGQFFA